MDGHVRQSSSSVPSFRLLAQHNMPIDSAGVTARHVTSRRCNSVTSSRIRIVVPIRNHVPFQSLTMDVPRNVNRSGIYIVGHGGRRNSWLARKAFFLKDRYPHRTLWNRKTVYVRIERRKKETEMEMVCHDFVLVFRKKEKCLARLQ